MLTKPAIILGQKHALPPTDRSPPQPCEGQVIFLPPSLMFQQYRKIYLFHHLTLTVKQSYWIICCAVRKSLQVGLQSLDSLLNTCKQKLNMFRLRTVQWKRICSLGGCVRYKLHYYDSYLPSECLRFAVSSITRSHDVPWHRSFTTQKTSTTIHKTFIKADTQRTI